MGFSDGDGIADEEFNYKIDGIDFDGEGADAEEDEYIDADNLDLALEPAVDYDGMDGDDLGELEDVDDLDGDVAMGGGDADADGL